MAPSTRNFLIGSTFVVVAGLCTGLVAYYGGALPGRDTARAEFSYIPGDVSAVAFANVRDIMDSQFLTKLREIMPTGGDKDRFFAETGIDIERDIDTVVAGFRGDGPTGGVVVLRGRFNQARIEELVLTHGGKQDQYGGRPLLVGLPKPPGEAGAHAEHVSALAFLDEGLVAIGDLTGVRKAVDTATANDGVTTNADLMRFIASVQDTGNAWLVGRASDVTGQPHVPDQVRGHLDGIEWVSVSANVDRDVRGLIRAEARDEQAGQQLRTVVAGALAAAKMFGQQDARFAAALNSVQVAGSGRTVELSFLVPPDVLALMHAPVPALPQ